MAHWYTTSHASGTPRNYVLNFVRFANLTSRATYTYKVKSGSVNGTWSRTYNFRAPYSAADGGETRIALYGEHTTLFGEFYAPNLVVTCGTLTQVTWATHSTTTRAIWAKTARLAVSMPFCTWAIVSLPHTRDSDPTPISNWRVCFLQAVLWC